MAINKALFSSNKQDWETPDELYKKLDEEFNFKWDACASKNNTKVPGCYFDEADDALSQRWALSSEVYWMNPPYGRYITGKWVAKAYTESQYGLTVVCLLPARTDTKWFHEYCLKGEIRFIKGRLKFKGAKHPAPFPSMIVVFRP